VEPPQPPAGQYSQGQGPQGRYPQGQYPQAHPQQTAPMPPGRVVDVTMSIVILVCAALVLVVPVGIALFFGLMSSSSCTTFDGGCGTSAGWAVAVIGSVAIFVATIAVTTVRLRRRRTAWWIAIWILGSVLASAGSA
jgi:hypothetical protein